MLGKTDPQENFFDAYIKDNFLPEEHELLEIKEKVDFSFIQEKTKDLYSESFGRTSYPPEVMFKILFLEFYYNLSDVEVVKQLKFNVLFWCSEKGNLVKRIFACAPAFYGVVKKSFEDF